MLKFACFDENYFKTTKMLFYFMSKLNKNRKKWKLFLFFEIDRKNYAQLRRKLGYVSQIKCN